MSDFIIKDFYNEMRNVRFEPYGVLDCQNKIHTLGTDSKIIGRIFEMYTQPILEKMANRYGMVLITPKSQTLYPDFIMMNDENSKTKIAIDIKTTYVASDHSTIKFTLGSYGSYMRNNTKNIEFKYTDYYKHYVIGFIYKRNGQAQESLIYDLTDRDKIEFPFYDVKYFMQEKYKIAGDKPGSGNTENIGSFLTKNFYDLKNGYGPFAELGVDAFDIYWKYYPKYRSVEKTYTSLIEFIEWFPKQSRTEIELFHKYDYDTLLERITLYARDRKMIAISRQD